MARNRNAVTLCALLSLFGTPTDAVVLAPGDILVADGCALASAARVIQIDPLTGSQQLVSEGIFIQRPVGIALEPDGRIVVSETEDGGTGAVVRIDPETGDQTIVSGSFTSLWDLAIEADGMLVVTDPGDAAVLRVDPSTGGVAPLSSGGSLELPLAIAVAPSGDIYATDLDDDLDETPKLLRIDPSNGAQTLVAAGFANPTGLAVRASDEIVVADSLAGQLVSVNPSNGAKTPVPGSAGLSFPFDVTNGSGGTLLVADWGDQSSAPAVIRVDPASGNATPVSSGGMLDEPCGIAVVAPEPTPGVVGAAAAFALAWLGTSRRRRTPYASFEPN